MSAPLGSGLGVDDFSTEVRPQDDLFRYVNGPWLDRTDIPPDKATWGGLYVLDDEAEDAVHEIIVASAHAEPGTDRRKVGDLFASFMDLDRVAERGASPLTPLLDEVDAVFDIPSFLAVAGRLQRDGLAKLIGVFVDLDPTDVSRYVPFLHQTGLNLPDESYYRLDSRAALRAAFRDHVARLLRIAEVVDPDGQADGVLAVETELAGHHWNNVKSRDVLALTNSRSWDELQGLDAVDLAPWRDAVAAGRAGVFDRMNVSMPSFLEGLRAMLTAGRVHEWKAWLRYQVVRHAAPFLSQPSVDEEFAFYGTELKGVPADRERWRRGAALVEEGMGEAVGCIYVERHFPPAAKEAADELVADLVEAYRRSISSLEWMGEATRARALAKLAAITTKIGHPSRWREYTSLDIDAHDLLGNVRRARAWELDRRLAEVGRPVDPDEWHITPQIVNAYYDPMRNEIIFPAAILQFPLFDAGRDAAANYGGIGAIIGHEIGHGFDDQGSRFDADGTLRDWWTDVDRASFEQRTAALIGQYEVLVPAGLSPENTVNGALTIGENIGDLGGVGIAIAAYRLHLERMGDSPDGPVVDGLTGIQRLLVSWAQAWRDKSRGAEALRMLTLDQHAPSEFRCNQVVRNLDAFHDAFDVSETDRMWLAPEDRVSIW